MEELSKKARRREEARLKAVQGEAAEQEKRVQEAAPRQEARKNAADSFIEKSKQFYVQHYKKMLIIPTLLLLFSFLQIGWQMSTTGDFLTKGVSLKGGIALTIPELEADTTTVERELLQAFPNHDIAVRSLSGAGSIGGITIDADILEEQGITQFQNYIEQKFSIAPGTYTIEIIGSALGENFFRQAFLALFLAFLFMAIVVFLYFRIPIPSLGVILAAFSDIVTTAAIINLLGIKLSMAGIAAFLMLIGYSVDTDILLTTRVLRRKEGKVIDGIFNAMRTGFMMTTTTLLAATIALFFSASAVVTQIMLILIIGLLSDLLYTWIQNAGILLWYLEGKA
ncbi:protein translocase subunit SecF [Candidatus Woesearchaeota archaeon]|nr:protein translocase subunit SecF [Candidatus Woesearchaeota archaeon]